MKKLILLFLILLITGQILAQDLSDYGTPFVVDSEGNPIIWKIDDNKTDEFFFDFLNFQQLLVLFRHSYDLQECVINLHDDKEIRKMVNFRSSPNEFLNNKLIPEGLPSYTIVEKLGFVPRVSSSQYAWVKVKYGEQVGYIASFALFCES